MQKPSKTLLSLGPQSPLAIPTNSCIQGLHWIHPPTPEMTRFLVQHGRCDRALFAFRDTIDLGASLQGSAYLDLRLPNLDPKQQSSRFSLFRVASRKSQSVRVGSWQNGVFAYFCFWPVGFCRGFSRRIFLLIFMGKSAQKNPPGKSLAKSSKFYTTTIPDAFLQRGQAKICNCFLVKSGSLTAVSVAIKVLDLLEPMAGLALRPVSVEGRS